MTTIRDMSFESLKRFRRQHPRASKIGNNTWLSGAGTDTDPFTIRFHATDIVEMTEGKIRFNTGGYQTYTTKDRMHRAMPAGCFLFQKDWQWFVQASPSADPVAVGDTFRLELRDGRWQVIA